MYNFKVQAPPCRGMHKAFPQIQLHEDDKDWTTFLWLSNPQDPNSKFARFRFAFFGDVYLLFTLNAALHCHLAQYKSPTAENKLVR